MSGEIGQYSFGLPAHVHNKDDIIMAGEKKVRHFKDIGYSVQAYPKDFHVDFMVYEIKGVEEKRTVERIIVGLELFAHGDVKWDGCSNWYFDIQDHVMLHGCTRSDLKNIGTLLARCWDWAAELLPNFDGEK